MEVIIDEDSYKNAIHELNAYYDSQKAEIKDHHNSFFARQTTENKNWLLNRLEKDRTNKIQMAQKQHQEYKTLSTVDVDKQNINKIVIKWLYCNGLIVRKVHAM